MNTREQSLLAHQYANFLTIWGLIVAAVTVGLGFLPIPLPLALLWGVKITCIVLALLGVFFILSPKSLFSLFFEVHEILKGDQKIFFEAAKNRDLSFLKSVFSDRKSATAVNPLRVTPLHVAAAEGNEIAVAHLLQMGANKNALTLDQNTPFSFALYGGNRQVADLLKNHGEDRCALGNGGISDLMVAAGTGTPSELAAALKQNSESLKYKATRDGFTALHFAALFGRAEQMDLLLKADPLLEIERAVVFLVVQSLSVETLDVLLRHDPDQANRRSGVGLSPLMLACQMGKENLVSALLAVGAETNVSDKFNKTALKYAQESKHSHIASLLKNHEDAALLAQKKIDRSLLVDEMFQMLAEDKLRGLDKLGARLAKDISEFTNSQDRSKVRVWHGAPETGKTTLAKRLAGMGKANRPSLSLPESANVYYFTGKEIFSREIDLQAFLKEDMPAKSVVMIDDADSAFDPDHGCVNEQDAAVLIRIMLTAVTEQKLYLILVGNFMKKRGGYTRALDASHLVAVFGPDFARWIEHEPWEFKPLSEKDLLLKFVEILKEQGFTISEKALIMIYARISQKSPHFPLQEFDKMISRIRVETEIEPDEKGQRLITEEHVAGVIT